MKTTARILAGLALWFAWSAAAAVNYVGSFTGTASLSNLVVTVQTNTVQLGPDLASGATYNFDGTWTQTGSSFQHTGAGTTPLAIVVPVTAGHFYQVSYTLSTITLGSVLATMSGYTNNYTANVGVLIGAKAVDATQLSWTPTSTFNGTISAVSIRQVSPALASMTLQDKNATPLGLWSGSVVLSNFFLGSASGQYVTIGSNNFAVGPGALQSVTSGAYLTALGAGALGNDTYGIQNLAVGGGALGNLTYGNANTAIGTTCLSNLITGTANTGVGYNTLFRIVTNSYNTAIGLQAMSFLNTGQGNTAIGYHAGQGVATANHVLTSEYCGFIGYNAAMDPSLPSTTDLSNAWAFGYTAIVSSNNMAQFGIATVPMDVYATGGLYRNVQTNNHAGPLNAQQPIGEFGFLSLSNAQNIAVAVAGTYVPITNFNYIITNRFIGAVTNGTLTNLESGFYRISINASILPPSAGDSLECDLFLNGAANEYIACHVTAPAGTPKAMPMSSSGILYLPAGTGLQIGITDANNTGNISVIHAQLVIGTP